MRSVARGMPTPTTTTTTITTTTTTTTITTTATTRTPTPIPTPTRTPLFLSLLGQPVLVYGMRHAVCHMRYVVVDMECA